MKAPRKLTQRELKDLKVLLLFTAIYCRVHHSDQKNESLLNIANKELLQLPLKKNPVCSNCASFLEYAFSRRLHCPLDEKPSCKHCPVHCYRSDHREQVKKIMQFSGRHLIMHGRLDLLWHYLF